MATTTPRVTIDAQGFPHILETILAASSYPLLLTWRLVSRHTNHLSNAILYRHIILRQGEWQTTAYSRPLPLTLYSPFGVLPSLVPLTPDAADRVRKYTRVLEYTALPRPMPRDPRSCIPRLDTHDAFDAAWEGIEVVRRSFGPTSANVQTLIPACRTLVDTVYWAYDRADGAADHVVGIGVDQNEGDGDGDGDGGEGRAPLHVYSRAVLLTSHIPFARVPPAEIHPGNCARMVAYTLDEPGAAMGEYGEYAEGWRDSPANAVAVATDNDTAPPPSPPETRPKKAVINILYDPTHPRINDAEISVDSDSDAQHVVFTFAPLSHGVNELRARRYRYRKFHDELNGKNDGLPKPATSYALPLRTSMLRGVSRAIARMMSMQHASTRRITVVGLESTGIEDVCAGFGGMVLDAYARSVRASSGRVPAVPAVLVGGGVGVGAGVRIGDGGGGGGGGGEDTGPRVATGQLQEPEVRPPLELEFLSWQVYALSEAFLDECMLPPV